MVQPNVPENVSGPQPLPGATNSESGLEPPLLSIHADNARMMYSMLRAIQFRETATFCANDNGLKITVEDFHCLQLTAFMGSELFEEYHLRAESVNFRINLAVLCDCLNIFGSASSHSTATNCTMHFAGQGAPLKITLEDCGVVADCPIKTMDPDEILAFDFADSNIVTKIIMKSDCLREAFSELDPSSETVVISMSPDNLLIACAGTCGEIEIEFAKTSSLIETFDYTRTESNRYRLSLLKPSIKALQLSSKVSLRIDHNGFLSLQFMIPFEENRLAFIEYFCAPEQEVDD